MATAQLAKSKSEDFSFLDVEEFRQKYAANSGAGSDQMCFYVGGIQCEKCIRKLEGLVESTPGLRQLRVEMGTKLVHVELEPAVLSFSQVAHLIAAQGFSPAPLTQDTAWQAMERTEARQALVRLAVAGTCAGNIMTFAFATYFGADWQLFAWLSFVLYLPVVSYVAWPFYVGAWTALKQRRISIDLPMAVASFTGFVFSTLGLLRGQPENIYFDSLSGFLFLILIARWSQRRLQSRFLRPEEMIEGMKLERVRVLTQEGWSWRPLKKLGFHDRFEIHEGECMPADAKLESERAHFSLAWITGEAKPKAFVQGSLVPAGSRLISGQAVAAVTTPFIETTFGKVLDQVQKFSLSRNQSILLSDVWAQRLLAVVFSVAAVFLILYWSISPQEAVQRALALIVLACPCAMAFGTPLALSAALKKTKRSGLVLRDANLLEKMRSVKTIFFDKTGTLTETDLQLRDDHSASDTQKALILALENQSLHPIAFAFRKAFVNLKPAQLTDVEEMPGVGVKCLYQGRLFELRRSSRRQNGTSCALFEDGRLLQEFQFEATLKPDCEESLFTLRKMGYRLELLSGDNAEAVRTLGAKLGFQASEIAAELSPQEKAQRVAQTSNCMMVGDGINDSLALMKADVGVATSGGVASALQSAGVYLTRSSLDGIVTLARISQDTFQLIRRNLMISVLYNVLGGTLALMGYINPFAAALLMPVSSGFILLSTYIWSRP